MPHEVLAQNFGELLGPLAERRDFDQHARHERFPGTAGRGDLFAASPDREHQAAAQKHPVQQSLPLNIAHRAQKRRVAGGQYDRINAVIAPPGIGQLVNRSDLRRRQRRFGPPLERGRRLGQTRVGTDPTGINVAAPPSNV